MASPSATRDTPVTAKVITSSRTGRPRTGPVPPASRPTDQTRTLRASTTRPAVRSLLRMTAPMPANARAVRVHARLARIVAAAALRLAHGASAGDQGHDGRDQCD
jgi:hypothetical protein